MVKLVEENLETINAPLRMGLPQEQQDQSYVEDKVDASGDLRSRFLGKGIC